MTPREVLLKAAALVERGWCQGAFAITSSNGVVSTSDEKAACFCALGAISRASADSGAASAHEATVKLGEYIDGNVNGVRVAAWNDAPGRTQAEVVAALKAAAEACT